MIILRRGSRHLQQIRVGWWEIETVKRACRTTIGVLPRQRFLAVDTAVWPVCGAFVKCAVWAGGVRPTKRDTAIVIIASLIRNCG